MLIWKENNEGYSKHGDEGRREELAEHRVFRIVHLLHTLLQWRHMPLYVAQIYRIYNPNVGNKERLFMRGVGGIRGLYSFCSVFLRAQKCSKKN